MLFYCLSVESFILLIVLIGRNAWYTVHKYKRLLERERILKSKKIVIAPDSFKESLTALEVATAIKEGFKQVYADDEYILIPMADGGEGTVQSIVDATNGVIKEVEVTGPLFKKVKAQYGLSGDKKLAVIEMASSSGLELLSIKERNPLKTTTKGFGELIKDALSEGVEELILGIGGSATNDGGIGMARALGAIFFDEQGEEIELTGEGLADLHSIDVKDLDSRLQDVAIRVACDVNNPLVGKMGASLIYGPQKGGSIEQIKLLDQNLTHYAKILKKDLGRDVKDIKGAGAAGGLGAGLLAFTDAELEEGGKLVSDLLNLEAHIRNADLVITGEGGVNHQTQYGKTPIVVSKIAQQYEVPCIALVGLIEQDFETIYDHGIDAVFSIIPRIESIEDLLENGYENLKMTAYNVAKVMVLK